MKFFINENEKNVINERAHSLNLSLSEYLRQMAINGVVVNVDYTDIKNLTQEINRIGININQITKRMNETHEVYAADVDAVKESLDTIWQLQRSILSSQR